MTVGYGDVLPTNGYEKMLVCSILIVGVAMFSYTLSALATQFSNLTRSASKRLDRDLSIRKLAKQHKLPFPLVRKMEFYFFQNDNVISMSKDYEINHIMKVLPVNLKTRLSMFLY